MQDLGHLLPSQPLIGNSSAAVGNTISDQAGSLTAPGSESEQTAGIKTGTPVVPMPAREGKRPVMEDGGSFRPSPVAWKELP